MKSIAMIVVAGAVVSMAGSAQALTPSQTHHRAVHVHHANHQPQAGKAQAEPQFAPGPEVIPDPEIYQHVM